MEFFEFSLKGYTNSSPRRVIFLEFLMVKFFYILDAPLASSSFLIVKFFSHKGKRTSALIALEPWSSCNNYLQFKFLTSWISLACGCPRIKNVDTISGSKWGWSSFPLANTWCSWRGPWHGSVKLHLRLFSLPKPSLLWVGPRMSLMHGPLPSPPHPTRAHTHQALHESLWLGSVNLALEFVFMTQASCAHYGPCSGWKVILLQKGTWLDPFHTNVTFNASSAGLLFLAPYTSIPLFVYFCHLEKSTMITSMSFYAPKS